jgi:NADP-dependent aldehyde dehydrogenase
MINELNRVLENAHEAFLQYQNTSGLAKRNFLYDIAQEIENLGDTLIQTASEESNLPTARFIGERARTCGQLRAFGDYIKEGSWVEAVIDNAQEIKVGLTKPDMRKMSISIGPIVVFGASNFLLAFSTAGGDTASVFAAGCPVIVKGHPGHPKTSLLVAGAIDRAVLKNELHPATFQHVVGDSFEIGKILTQHPLTAGVGFTGSLIGGRAIYDYASQRQAPIPVFSEMGSTKPVILMKDALKNRAAEIAKAYAGSITAGVGQFCTNPGILLGIKSSDLSNFTSLLATELSSISAFKMLHGGIHKNYNSGLDRVLNDKGVETIYHARAEGDLLASPVLVRVDGDTFLKNTDLHHEVFGPFSMVVVCENKKQLVEIWKSLAGQLTTTFMATDLDLAENRDLINDAKNIAGRIVFNNVPTGVEVSHAMVHGGPYPATTDGRFTSVGMDAIKRWVRPVCFQDCPDSFLPDELKDSNPLGIMRKVDGNLQRN